MDFLKDRETGLFTRVNDPKDIADKVEELLNNEELREEIVKSAREMVKERYNWDIITDKMKNEIFASIRI